MNCEGFAVITGASAGLGRALTIELAATRRWSLVLVGRDAARLITVKKEVEDLWGAHGALVAQVRVCDLASAVSRLELVKELRALPISLLVNNAGQKYFGAFLSEDAEVYRQLIEVNCHAPMDLIHALLPTMKANGRAVIVNICSRWAKVPGPYLAVYAASKAFLCSMSLALAGEMRSSGVTFLAQCPGDMAPDAEEARRRARVLPWLKSPSTREVARQLVRSLDRRRWFHVTGLANRVFVRLANILPSKWTSVLIELALRRSALVQLK